MDAVDAAASGAAATQSRRWTGAGQRSAVSGARGLEGVQSKSTRSFCFDSVGKFLYSTQSYSFVLVLTRRSLFFITWFVDSGFRRLGGYGYGS